MLGLRFCIHHWILCFRFQRRHYGNLEGLPNGTLCLRTSDNLPVRSETSIPSKALVKSKHPVWIYVFDRTCVTYEGTSKKRSLRISPPPPPVHLDRQFNISHYFSPIKSILYFLTFCEFLRNLFFQKKTTAEKNHNGHQLTSYPNYFF